MEAAIVFSVDDLPVAIGVGVRCTPVVIQYAAMIASTPDGVATDTTPLTPLRAGGHPLTPPASAKHKGWVRNQLPECPWYLGYEICAYCIRLGKDFRKNFCNFKE